MLSLKRRIYLEELPLPDSRKLVKLMENIETYPNTLLIVNFKHVKIRAAFLEKRQGKV